MRRRAGLEAPSSWPVSQIVLYRKDDLMASYKYGEYLHENKHEEFDKEYSPGATCPNSGVWRCANCGDEIAANKGDRFRRRITISMPLGRVRFVGSCWCSPSNRNKAAKAADFLGPSADEAKFSRRSAKSSIETVQTERQGCAPESSG